MAMASPGVHGQFTSSISSTVGPTASRAAFTEATSVWWSLSMPKPWDTKDLHAAATSEGEA